MNTIDIISILGVLQGLFLAIVLRKKDRNNKANNLLSLLLVLCSIMLVTRIILLKNTNVVLFQRLSLIEPVIFLYGPLSFQYLKYLTQGKVKTDNYRLVYIPAIFYSLILIYINIIPTDVFVEKLGSQKYLFLFFAIELAALVHNLYYWFLCNKILLRYRENFKYEISYFQKSMKFVSIFHYLMASILLFWIIGFIGNNLLGLKNPIIGYNAIWIALSTLIYVIGYFAINQPEIFKLDELRIRDLEGNKDYQRLSENEITELKSRLDMLMKEKKPYLENEITLSLLSKKLNTSTNNLSWFLNNVYNTNFYDFINEYRIKEFIKKVKNKEHTNHTLLALSMEVGFNSKSTFNKAFKYHKNETPSSFIKKISA